ncbi:VWA domain-containing protein [Raineya orbicola]|uniref:von Willebrand factor type A domain n=1 Tax=Raineya orbicola TaxID=2016530 RepID=A0A2N3IF60_9BACT|nr:VWA domain-containing protein [Raineya orbicola]PKQ68863.1 von Willebrand factor type A domain [Raineya orbicola]
MNFLFLIETEGWYRWEHFLPQTFREYVWENPFWLYAMPFALLLFLLRWFLALPTRQKLVVTLPADTKKLQKGTFLRFVPDVILLMVLWLVMLALARPQKVNEKVQRYSEGIDIMIALDVSESMLYEDYNPNRLQAALQVAKNFIKSRLYEDRIGIVVFSGEAFTLIPLTTDYELLENILSQEIQGKMTNAEGTALGDALAVCTNRLLQSKSKSKVVILISDGDSNTGKIAPLEAAQIAQKEQIKVYPIITASYAEQVPFGKDALGKPQMYENAIDEQIMRQIAQITQGEFYRAESVQSLEKTLNEISAREKSEVLEIHYSQAKDFYRIYLIWAVIFWLLWLALKLTFMNNALKD